MNAPVIIANTAEQAALIRQSQAQEWHRIGFCRQVIDLLQLLSMELIGTDSAYRGSHEFRMPRGELEYITISIDPHHTEKDIVASIYAAGRRDLRDELNEIHRRENILLGRPRSQ
jgi:hypothetical protein